MVVDLFNYPILCRFGINDEFIPNPMLNLGFMPLFVVEHFVIPFDPNGPKRNALKEVSIFFDYFAVFLRNNFPKQCLQSIEAIIVVSSNPMKFMHNKRGPYPHLSCLNAIPEFVFD